MSSGVLMRITIVQRRRKEVWDGGGQNHRGSGDGSPPAGWSRGGAPVGFLGDDVLQKLKNFKSSYKQILRVFFSVLAGIIPLSLRNGGI